MHPGTREFPTTINGVIQLAARGSLLGHTGPVSRDDVELDARGATAGPACKMHSMAHTMFKGTCTSCNIMMNTSELSICEWTNADWLGAGLEDVCVCVCLVSSGPGNCDIKQTNKKQTDKQDPPHPPKRDHAKVPAYLSTSCTMLPGGCYRGCCCSVAKPRANASLSRARKPAPMTLCSDSVKELSQFHPCAILLRLLTSSCGCCCSRR